MTHTNRHNTAHPGQTTTPTKIRPLRRVCGLALVMIGLGAAIVSASTIAVTNGSFEDPTPHNPNNGTTADWTAGGWAFVGSPWTASTANYGRLSQGPVASPQLGNWIFNLNDTNGWIKQDLGTTVNAGDTVSVTFHVMRDTAPGQIDAAFLVGAGPTVYSQTFNNPQNNGTLVPYTLTQTIAVTGNLSLRFSNVSGRLWLDNVSAVTVTSGSVDPNAPTSTNATLTAVEDTATALAAGNFGYADPNNVALAAVQITSLPLQGTLKSGGTVISGVPLTVAVADIGTLTYQPALNGNGTGYATLGIKVRNANNVRSSTAWLTVNVTRLNHAPTSTGASAILATGTDKTFAAGDFRFADVDAGDTLGAIQVVTSLPAHGTLKLNGTIIPSVPGAVIPVANIGTLTYTPNPGYSGADSFKYQVKDATVFSADATMAITVTSATSDILVSNGSFETPGPNGGAWATFGSPWSVTGSPSI